MEKPDFGKKLIEVRKAKGLTQGEVAEKCNVAVRTIQRIESGSVQPRAFTIKVISNMLEFDFFEIPDTGCDVNKEENRSSSRKKRALLWYIKDLFNFKKNAMKKISILTTFLLMVTMAVFAFVPETKASTKKRPHCIITKDKIDVIFTNELTFDSLVVIKNELEMNGVLLNYQKLVFDDNNHLFAIDCKMSDSKSSGSFSVNILDDTARPGFYYDYSPNTKSPFGVGHVFD